MNSVTYYDRKRSRPIVPHKDGCDLVDWNEAFEQYSFARHPQGFPIFLSPTDLEQFDEYKESDPYTVELNYESDFHQRRIQCTLDLITQVANHLPDKLRILDLGCGQGHITSKIHTNFPNSEVLGLDYSVSAIEYAVTHYPNIEFAVGNAYNLPYSENYFDIVVCNNIWEHVPDPLRLLDEIKRVIKPERYLIVSTPSRYRFGNLVRVLLGKRVVFMSKHHVTEYSVGQVVEQMEFGGFDEIQVVSKTIGTWKSRLAKFLPSLVISLVGSSST